MEDDDNEQGLIRNWMKHVLTYTTSFSFNFNFQSLLTRQILSAVSGLLVNLLFTQLITRFVDADFRFRSTSLEWDLVVLSFVSLLLAFVIRYLMIKVRSVEWYSSTPVMAMDMDGGAGDEMDHIGQRSDYTVFTSFRFPVPEYLLPAPQRIPVADVNSERASATVSSIISTEPLRRSPSLSEPQPPPPPPPSYYPQWVTSIPTTTSADQRLVPSAPPSPIKGKGKLKARSSSSRQTTRLKNMNPKTCLLHQSLLHPTNVIPRQKSLAKNTLGNSERSRGRKDSGSSSSQNRSWAWEFMEKASFDQFKRDYANFRNINSSLLGAFATDTLRAEASQWIKGRGESDTNEGQKARVSLAVQVSPAKEDHRQLQKPVAPATATAPVPPAFLQAVTSEVNPGVKKMVERKAKCAGCLKTFLPPFCFQRRKREQRRWNSRRFRQISHAPLLWSPIHPPITTTMTSPPTIRCI